MQILTDIGHVFYGIAAGVLYPELMTLIFLFKQYFDWKSHKEAWKDTSRDITEFSIGLILGFILRRFLSFPSQV